LIFYLALQINQTAIKLPSFNVLAGYKTDMSPDESLIEPADNQ